jgi:hypothetical protein
MYKRLILVSLVSLAPALAQNKAAPTVSTLASSVSLPAAEKDMQDTEAVWSQMARTMEERISHLLPCDQAAIRIVDEAAKASDARMAAQSRYLQALHERAGETTKAASAVVEEMKLESAAQLGDRNDTEQERAGIESRVGNLDSSVSQKPSLLAARVRLQELQSLVGDRAMQASTQAVNSQQAMAALQVLITALESREAALAKQSAPLQEEQLRWKGYYAARTARARVECSVAGGAPAPPATRAK